MSEEKKEPILLPKGFWIEKNEKGEKLYCHKAKWQGKSYTIKRSLEEFRRLLS